MALQESLEANLWNAVRDHYETQQFDHAVLDAMRLLTAALRSRTGLHTDGAALVGQALGGNPPPVRLNAYRTASEVDEQRGYEQIVRGLYTGVRNPRTHDNWADSQRDADAIIGFIDLVIRRINAAHMHFDVDAYKARVFDPLFVESLEYAQLIVSEIPTTELPTVFESVFADRAAADPKRLVLFFRALLQRMTDQHREEAARVVSESLRLARTHTDFIAIIRFLRPGMWPLLAPDARARTEASVIASISEGKRDAFAGTTTGGGLGTWANTFGRHFDRRHDLIEAIRRLLHIDWYTQNYVGQYFMSSIPSLVDTTEQREAICEGIAYAAFDNDARVLRSRLLEAYPRYPDEWKNDLQRASLPYETEDPDFFARIFGDAATEQGAPQHDDGVV